MSDTRPSVALKTPVEANGMTLDRLTVRHEVRAGDLAAVGRYLLRHEIAGLDPLHAIAQGDLGAMLALMDAVCQVPEGTCEQLSLADMTEVLAMCPFGKSEDGPATGKPASDPSPSP